MTRLDLVLTVLLKLKLGMTRLDLVLTVLVKVKTWYDKVRLELVVTVLGAVNLPHRQGHFFIILKKSIKKCTKTIYTL